MFNPILIDFIVQHLAGGRPEMASVLINFALRLLAIPV